MNLRVSWKLYILKVPVREDIEYIEDPDMPYGDNEQLNRIYRRLRDHGQLEEASSSSRPAVLPSSSSRLPVSSSSSSRPLVLQQRPKPRPAAPPVAPPPRSIFRNLLSSEIQRLELQIHEQQGPVEGAKAILSWDHHNVLDSYRTSLNGCSKADGGYYPPESRQVLQTAAHQPLCRFTQVILSVTATLSTQCATSSLAPVISKRYLGL